MQPSDRRQFAESLTHLFSTYDAELTERVLTIWWGVLEPYKLSAVLAAMSLHVGDTRVANGTSQAVGHFKPQPADVKYHLDVTLPQMMDERRAKIAAEAHARIAPLRERIATIQNDARLGIPVTNAEGLISRCRQEINQIMRENEVALALAPGAALRDQEAEVAPRDRMPRVVRQALGWLGKLHG